jgi:hypothetical protein
MKSLEGIHFAGNYEGKQVNVYHRWQPDASAANLWQQDGDEHPVDNQDLV